MQWIIDWEIDQEIKFIEREIFALLTQREQAEADGRKEEVIKITKQISIKDEAIENLKGGKIG
jgi:hypothetical protein